MSYTPKNNFNLQLKRTGAGEIGFRKKLWKTLAGTCNALDYFFRWEPLYEGLSRSDFKTIEVAGGIGDFNWSIVGAGFTLDDAVTVGRTNIVRTDGTVLTGDDAVVTVVDSCGSSVEGEIKSCFRIPYGGYDCSVVDGTMWVRKAPKFNTEGRAYCLTVFNDKIYAGTAQKGNGSYLGGLLLEWNGVDAWTQVAGQLNSQANINALTIYHDEIYAVTSSGGRLFKWNGSNAWIQLADKYSNEANVISITVYNDKIYGGTNYGWLLEWNGSDAWIRVAPANNGNLIQKLLVLDSKLYGVANWGSSSLLVWNDVDAWIEKAPQLNGQRLYGATIYNDKIYAGTGTSGTAPTGRLFEWNEVDAWIQVAPQLGEGEIRSLYVFEGRLYAGTYSSGKLYRWNDTDAWEEMAPRFSSEIIIYDLIALNHQLYGGTGNWGNLLMWDSEYVCI